MKNVPLNLGCVKVTDKTQDICFLLGSNASGKSSVVRYLSSEKIDEVYVCTMSDLLKNSQNPEVQEAFTQYSMRGENIPCKLAIAELQQFYEDRNLRQEKVLVLDGAGRTVKQIEEFYDFFRRISPGCRIIFCFLEIDEETMIKRTEHRLNTSNNPRTDDRLEVAIKRFQNYLILEETLRQTAQRCVGQDAVYIHQVDPELDKETGPRVVGNWLLRCVENQEGSHKKVVPYRLKERSLEGEGAFYAS